MTNLKIDSPLCRRIVSSFVQFLHSIESSAGADREALDVAKECLAAVFKIDESSLDNHDSLVDIFSSIGNEGVSDVPTTSLGKDAVVMEASQSKDKATEPHSPGKDELFGQLFGALEKIRYFRTMPDGNDDQNQLDKATQLCHNAMEEMQAAGCQTFDPKGLAETFKSQGNKAMQSKLYTDAIELYTFAIALLKNNAVYYCNRAAAYTQVKQYAEAVQDCLKSIEISPNYSKAYSRLGFAYYAQGKYRDATDKGFTKALQLDPNNDSVKENIRVCEQKLIEEQRRTGVVQSSNFAYRFDLGADGTTDISSVPIEMSDMLMNMASNAFAGQNFENVPAENETGERNNEPGIRTVQNSNFNLNDLPEELSGALSSMMGGMFSGAAAPNGNQQGGGNGRPPASS